MRKEGICPATLADCQGREVRFSLRGGKDELSTFGRAGPSFFAIFLLLHAAHTAVSHSAVRRECPLGPMPTAGKRPYSSRLWSRAIAGEGSVLSIPSPQRSVRRRGSLLVERGGSRPVLCVLGGRTCPQKGDGANCGKKGENKDQIWRLR